jgi:hypothetical protein
LTPKSVEVLGGNKITKMFQAMAIVSLKMGNLGLEVKSLKTKLTTVEEEKQGLLKQIQKEQQGYEEYIQCMQTWNKQKKEMEEKVNVKMMWLAIENKEMTRKLMEFPNLKKEKMKLR